MFELTFTFENGESPVKISVSPEETLPGSSLSGQTPTRRTSLDFL